MAEWLFISGLSLLYLGCIIVIMAKIGQFAEWLDEQMRGNK